MSKQGTVCRYLELFNSTPIQLLRRHYAIRMGVHLSLLPPEAKTISKKEIDLILLEARKMDCSSVYGEGE